MGFRKQVGSYCLSGVAAGEGRSSNTIKAFVQPVRQEMVMGQVGTLYSVAWLLKSLT